MESQVSLGYTRPYLKRGNFDFFLKWQSPVFSRRPAGDTKYFRPYKSGTAWPPLTGAREATPQPQPLGTPVTLRAGSRQEAERNSPSKNNYGLLCLLGWEVSLAQTGPALLLFQAQPPECWDHRTASSPRPTCSYYGL